MIIPYQPFNVQRYRRRAAPVARVAGGVMTGGLVGGAIRRYFSSPQFSRDISNAARVVRVGKRAYNSYNRSRRRNGRKGAKPRAAKKIKKIEKQIKKIKRVEDADTATLIFRVITANSLRAGDNVQTYQSTPVCHTGQIETFLANLKMYDVTNPGTLLTVSGSTGTYRKRYLFENVTSKLTVRNNYQTDADVHIYICSVKDDTDLSPTQLWESGALDQGGVATTAYGQFPTDIDMLKSIYNVKKVTNQIFSSGQQSTFKHSVNDIEYDPSLVDTHNLTYQREYKCFFWLVLVRPCLGHNDAGNEVGLVGTGVDCLFNHVATIKYDAGANLKMYENNVTGLSTFSNTGVQGQKPIPDNVAYSIA